jgi:hypothetical protein
MNGPCLVDLEVTEVEGIVCPRLFPWGPSSSVNEVKLLSTAAGVTLVIEMQSGDLLKINCKEVLERKIG